MAETKKLLVKIGAGTSYTFGALDPKETRAVVTEFISSGVTGEAGYRINTFSDSGTYFAGDPNAPIRTSTVVGLGGGTGLKIKKYGRSGAGGGGGRRGNAVVSRVTAGITSFTRYQYLKDESEKVENTAPDPNDPTRILVVPFQRRVATIDITWRSSNTTGRALTAGVQGMVGKVNSQVTVTVDGYGFVGKGRFLFKGVNTTHRLDGSFDSYYSGSWSPEGWKEEVVDKVTFTEAGKANRTYKMVDMYDLAPLTGLS